MELNGDAIAETANRVGQLKMQLKDSRLEYLESGGAIQDYLNKHIDMQNKFTEGKAVLSGYTEDIKKNINVVDEAKEAIGKETGELQTQLTVLQDADSQRQRTNNAILENAIAYEESAQKIRDLNAIMSDGVAHYQAVQTAVNETAAALMEESIQLDAAIQSADSAEQSQMRLANAYKSGVVEIKEWANGLAEAQAEQEGQIDTLEGMGLNFQKLPDFMEPTIENLKLMGEAATQNADKLVAFGDAIRESFAKATSVADSSIQELMDLFDKEEANEKFEEWFEGLPEAVRESLSAAEAVELKSIAKMRNNFESMREIFSFNVVLHGMDAAREEYATGLRDMADTSDGIWNDITETAADIVEKGSIEAIDKMNEIMSSGLEPEAILKQLKDLKIAEEGKRLGNDFSMSFNQALQSGFAESSRFMGGARFQELLKTQPGQASKVDVDTSAAHSKLKAFHSALTAITQITVAPKIDVEASAAHGKLTALHQALTAITQITVAPKIDVEASAAHSKLTALHSALTAITQIKVAPTIQVNTAPAMQQLASLKNQINAVKQTRVPPIRVNIAPGLALVRQLQNAINSIRQTRVPKVTVNASQAFSTINRVKSQLNSLKNISRTITYRYRTVGSPPRGAQTGMHETLAADTAIMAHKGERVDITPGSGHGATVAGPLGGSRTINVSVPVFLDGKVITRVVRRHLAEDVTAGM